MKLFVFMAIVLGLQFHARADVLEQQNATAFLYETKEFPTVRFIVRKLKLNGFSAVEGKLSLTANSPYDCQGTGVLGQAFTTAWTCQNIEDASLKVRVFTGYGSSSLEYVDPTTRKTVTKVLGRTFWE